MKRSIPDNNISQTHYYISNNKGMMQGIGVFSLIIYSIIYAKHRNTMPHYEKNFIVRLICFEVFRIFSPIPILQLFPFGFGVSLLMDSQEAEKIHLNNTMRILFNVALVLSIIHFVVLCGCIIASAILGLSGLIIMQDVRRKKV